MFTFILLVVMAFFALAALKNMCSGDIGAALFGVVIAVACGMAAF